MGLLQTPGPSSLEVGLGGTGTALQWDRSGCEGETEAGMGVDREMVTGCGGHQEGVMWGPRVT